MGNLLGVRPIITMDDKGIMHSVGKARGRENAIERLVSYVEELGENVSSHRIIIGHSDCMEIAEKLEKRLKEKFGDNLTIEYSEVNPTAGSHCGPSGVGVCFYAKHR